MAYTDYTALKLYANITNSQDDTLLTALIARAQGIIDGYTGRTFEASADTTRYFDAVRDVDGQTLWLDKELAAITTITNGDSQVVATTQYTAEPRNASPKYAIRLLPLAGVVW